MVARRPRLRPGPGDSSRRRGRCSGRSCATRVRVSRTKELTMGYWLVKLFAAPILRLLFRPYVTGADNLPVTGGAILAGNHTTFLDNLIIPLVVPRKVTFLAKSDYFTGGGIKGLLQKHFFSGVGMIPLDRSGGAASEAALRTGLGV